MTGGRGAGVRRRGGRSSANVSVVSVVREGCRAGGENVTPEMIEKGNPSPGERTACHGASGKGAAAPACEAAAGDHTTSVHERADDKEIAESSVVRRDKGRPLSSDPRQRRGHGLSWRTSDVIAPNRVLQPRRARLGPAATRVSSCLRVHVRGAASGRREHRPSRRFVPASARSEAVSPRRWYSSGRSRNRANEISAICGFVDDSGAAGSKRGASS